MDSNYHQCVCSTGKCTKDKKNRFWHDMDEVMLEYKDIEKNHNWRGFKYTCRKRKSMDKKGGITYGEQIRTAYATYVG